MLRWAAAATDPVQVMNYFIKRERKGVADYFLIEEEQGIGYWAGEAAQRLGLTHELNIDSEDQTRFRLGNNTHTIQHDDFINMTLNRSPQRPDDTLTTRHKEGRRIGWDISFSVPKSVSLLWTVTQDNRILSAIQNATDQTMKMMEQHAAVRVRKGGADHDRTTGNAVWATFLHYASRPTSENDIPDPQLHTHAFLFNVSYDKTEGQWKALQNGRMRQRARYFEAVYHAKLASSISEMGIGIERRGAARWEIAAAQRQLIERFSSRTRQIEAKARELGIRDPKKLAELGAKTRGKKIPNITLEQLHELWHEKFTPEELHALSHAEQFESDVPVSVEQAVDHAITHCFERHSVIEDYRIKEQALRYAPDAISPEDVDEEFSRRVWISHTDEEDVTTVTTQEVLDEERWLVDYARDGLGRYGPLGDPDRVIRPIELEDGTQFELNSDQQAACRHLWVSYDKIMSIRGKAGTGKTTLIMEAVKGIEANGKKVIALAPSAEASRGVLREEAKIKNANTVEMFLTNPHLRLKAKNQVILVDEASLIGMRTMVRLMKEAEKLNARVILVGDAMQHKSVERGDVLRLLQTYAGVKPVLISKILRQKGEYRRAVDLLSKGKTVEGYQKLEKLGWVHEIEDDEKRYAQLGKDYVDVIEQGKKPLAISPTHSEGELVNQAIRRELKARGHLDMSQSKTVGRQKNLQWTEAQKADPTNYEIGMKVYFHKSTKGFLPGQWAEIVGKENGKVLVQPPKGKVKALELDKASRMSVYQTKGMECAVGDKVRFTQNVKVLTAGKYHHIPNLKADIRKREISNGTECVVTGFAKSTGRPVMRQIDKDGKAIKSHFEVPQNAGLFTHAYCTTSHASQGKTVDQVFIAQSAESYPAGNVKQFYVSASRGKEQASIYTDKKQDFVKAIEQADSITSAIAQARRAGIDVRFERTRDFLRYKVLEKSRDLQHKAYELSKRTREILQPLDRFRELRQTRSSKHDRFYGRGRGRSYGYER